MTNEKIYECPLCDGETPMQDAKKLQGVKMFLWCSECGKTLSDEEVGKLRMRSESE